MATKSTTPGKPATAKPAAKSADVAKFAELPDKAQAEALAKTMLRPSVNAALVIMEYTKPHGEQDISAMIDRLDDGVKDVWAGDRKRAEAMLYGQAHALQAIFMSFSRRALHQQHQKHLESFLRMALKAQNQCRMTLETLATIKNPPVVFARQANIAHGPQQVNNGAPPGAWPAGQGFAHSGAHAANHSTGQTELLEASDGQRMDVGTTGTASEADPHLEAVAAVHRPAQR